MRAVCLLLVVVAQTGCARHSFDRYMAAGDRYMSSQKYAEAIIEYRNAIRLDPLSAAAEVKLGGAYAALNDFIGAAIAYERAWNLDQSDPEGALKAGSARLALGDFTAAAEYAREALQLAPSSVDAYVMLAKALGGAGDSTGAEQQLKTAMVLAPGNPRPYQVQGELHWRTGERRAAEASLLKAIELDPSASEARVALAQVYRQLGRVDDSERQLRAALDGSPDDPAANREYASLLVATERCENAEPYWKKVAAESTDGSGALALADYYVFTGRPDDAVRVLEPLTKGRDEGSSARLRLASIRYDRGDRRSAERLSDQVLAHDGSNVIALLLKARIFLDNGNRSMALEYAGHAAQLWPDVPLVRSVLAAAEETTGGARH